VIKDKAILPISYFGPIKYYKLLNTNDCKIEQHENYQKRTIRNRTKVLAANGILSLSVPLRKGKTQSTITETLISNDTAWREVHIKSIKSAYSSSPYFEYYFDAIAELIAKPHRTLFELDLATINHFSDLGIIEPVSFTKSYVKVLPEDQLDFRAEKDWLSQSIEPYIQVFESKFGFTPQLSILDALFNLGPETGKLINE